ncbi:MAG: hypothetical protein M3373_05740 [Gemmatimonadota bacterium]|nr:hypothetical protein [Gemmatimonadota bacterium]
MNTFTLLALLSVVAVAALFVALALFLGAITSTLETIGGEAKVYGAKASFLSKIRLGVRAIEVQTGAIAPQVTKLNATLTSVRDGLVAVDNNLAGVIAAVSKQEAR